MLFRGIPKRSRRGRVLGVLTHFSRCLPRKPRWVRVKKREPEPFRIICSYSPAPRAEPYTPPPVENEPYDLSEDFTPEEIEKIEQKVEAFREVMASLGEPYASYYAKRAVKSRTKPTRDSNAKPQVNAETIANPTADSGPKEISNIAENKITKK